MSREQLELATNNVTPEQNIFCVAALLKQFQHSILQLPSVAPLSTYTCLVHALGFTGTTAYTDVANPYPWVFAGAKFAEWLLRSGALQEVPRASAVNGDLVWYFCADNSFKHVGILRENGRVESKWGTLGLFEHQIFEVPESYGREVRFFEALSFENSIELFYDFAQENDVQFVERTP